VGVPYKYLKKKEEGMVLSIFKKKRRAWASMAGW
jgi:hypothetical protein